MKRNELRNEKRYRVRVPGKTYEVGDVLMGLQLIPLGLVVEYVVGQIDDHLADEVVGAVTHIVPQCDL